MKKDFNKILKAHTKGVKFEQQFTCKKEYNKRAKQLRMMGFIIDGEMSH